MEKKTNRCFLTMTRNLKLFILMGIMVLLTALPVHAAVQKNTWITNKGYYYYRDGKGKIVTGVKVIKKKCYLFDEKGRQLHGWRKVGGKYYYFRHGKGAKGNLTVSTKVNGLAVNEKGVAQLPTSAHKLKAAVLANYAVWTDTFTRPTMTRKEKLYACLLALKKFGYLSEGDSIIIQSNWDVTCAREMFERRNTTKKGNCYRFASAFAYMANAIGYKDVQVCAYTGHGWTKINGNIFDITYAIRLGPRYFPVPGDKQNLYHAEKTRDLRKM